MCSKCIWTTQQVYNASCSEHKSTEIRDNCCGEVRVSSFAGNSQVFCHFLHLASAYRPFKVTWHVRMTVWNKKWKPSPSLFQLSIDRSRQYMNALDRLVKPKASVTVSVHVSTVIKHVEKQNGCCLDHLGSHWRAFAGISLSLLKYRRDNDTADMSCQDLTRRKDTAGLRNCQIRGC